MSSLLGSGRCITCNKELTPEVTYALKMVKYKSFITGETSESIEYACSFGCAYSKAKLEQGTLAVASKICKVQDGSQYEILRG